MKKTFIAVSIILSLAMLAVAVSAATKPSTIDNGLVIHYDFEEAADSTEVKDTAGNNTVTGIDPSRRVEGNVGKGALSFRGDLADNLGANKGANPDATIPDGDGSYSFACWVKTELTSDGALYCFGSFAGNTGTWGFIQGSTSNLGGAGRDGNGGYVYNYAWNYNKTAYGEDGIVMLNDGEWHHIAITYDKASSTCFTYIDGKLFDTLPTDVQNVSKPTMVLDPMDDWLFIGGRSGDSAYNGVMDEVRVYNRAISAAEVAYLASVGKSVSPDTGDMLAIGSVVAVAAICGTAVVIKKKKH